MSDLSANAPPRVTFSRAKGSEVVGILLLGVGLLTAGSLASYHPLDASFLRQASVGELPVHNWIGRVGAQAAAAGFGVLGITCLLVPLLLLLSGWRNLSRKPRPRVVGRGVGGALLFAALPALFQLVLPKIPWWQEPIDSGGASGILAAAYLESRLNAAGALVLLVALVAVGSTLLVQSSLGDLLAAWRASLVGLWERWQLARARRAERQEKERARQRVVDKHLQRVVEEKKAAARDAADSDAPPPRYETPPVRVTQRSGERDHLVRRVSPGVGSAAAGPAPRPSTSALPLQASADPAARHAAVLPTAGGSPPRPAVPQRELPFIPPPNERALPPLNLLQLDEDKAAIDENELVRLGETIRQRCAEFGVDGTIEGINPGPVITVYEFQPAPGVKVSQIVNLQDDLALALKAESVRIDRIPGRSTLGIEVPNRQRATIRLGALMAREEFRRAPSALAMAIGYTIRGEPYYADLATMPHLLVAGATGSGKSVGLQCLITSILYRATRDQVQFIFIDPKRIELGVYADIPHLKAEVVVEPKKAANALRWAVGEMERRYRLLAEVHVRSIEYYNRAIGDPEVQKRLSLTEGDSVFEDADLRPLPYYVIVIDELADLMMVAAAEVETSIARLAQMARAVGIHLIVATQRPSVDILTGTIKANFPCRVSFATASRHDSRTILDQIGAEKLLGKGDMLFMPPGTSRTVRLHGAYVSEQETAALVRWLKKQGKPELDPAVVAAPESDGGEGGAGEIDDDLFEEAARLVVAERQASASFLQRRMRVGFSRAARLIDMMEREGLLGPAQGSKPRDVLVKPDYFEEVDRVKDGR